jgi:hypothetical protein
MPSIFDRKRETLGRNLIVASVLAAMAVSSLLGPSGAMAQPKGAVGAGSSSAAPAGPVTDEKRKEAAERFKRGVQLQADGNLDAAVIEFERAYELAPAYQVLYNIAVVYRDKNDRASALRAFERFLHDGGPKVDAKKRKDVETEIAKLKEVVASITIKSNVVGAEVRLDDLPIGKTPIAQPILVNVGRHKIEVSKEGYKSDSQFFALAGKDERVIEFNLEEIKKDPPPPPPPTATTQPTSTATAAPTPAPTPIRVTPESANTKPLGYGLAIGGILGVGLGSYFGLSAMSKRDESKCATKGERYVCPDEPSVQLARDARSQGNLSTLSFGLGGVALVAGIAFILTSGPSDAPRKTGVQVVPSVGQKEGGLNVLGRFLALPAGAVSKPFRLANVPLTRARSARLRGR